MEFLSNINIAQAITLFVIADLFFSALSVALQLFGIKIEAIHLFELPNSSKRKDRYIKLLEQRIEVLESHEKIK